MLVMRWREKEDPSLDMRRSSQVDMGIPVSVCGIVFGMK